MSEDNPRSEMRDRLAELGVEYGKSGTGKVMQYEGEPYKPLVIEGEASPEELHAEAALYMDGYQQAAGQTNFVENNIDGWFADALSRLDDHALVGQFEDLDRAKDTLVLAHHALGLTSEAGEVAGKIKKVIRDKQGYLTAGEAKEIAKEMGDVLWYLAALCTALNVNMSEVAAANLEKLFSRKQRGVLGGSGDNR